MVKADHNLQLYKLEFQSHSSTSLTAQKGGAVSGGVTLYVRPVDEYIIWEKDATPKYFYSAEDVDWLFHKKVHSLKNDDVKWALDYLDWAVCGKPPIIGLMTGEGYDLVHASKILLDALEKVIGEEAWKTLRKGS